MNPPRLRILRFAVFAATLLAITACAYAQYQQSVPPVERTGPKPSPTFPEPRGQMIRLTDLIVFAAALGAASWAILRYRRRWVVTLLLIGSVAYFGFYRGGCVCPIGATQNVAHSLTDPTYTISIVITLLFLLPIALALLAGRVFCGGLCWLGAVQDLLLLRSVRVPLGLDKILRWLRWVYLLAALVFAVGLLAGLGRRYIICEYDPFVNLFRTVNVRAALAGDFARVIEPTGPWWMWIITGGLLLTCLFIGRPYCRWLCPYGAVLGACSRAAKKPVTVMPNDCCDCDLCEDACPFGAIENHKAVPSSCVACTRCYDACPLERERRGLAVVETAPAEIPEPEPAPALPARTPVPWQRIHPAHEHEDVSYIDQLVARFGRGHAAALPILQAIQARHRYLPIEALEQLCQRSDLSMAELTALSTFYNQFRLAPIGKHLVCVCHGTACHVAGAERITEAVRRELDLTDPEEDTDADRLFTVERVGCVGCCSLAPVMQIDGVTLGHLTPDTAARAVVNVREGKLESELASAAHPLGESDKPGCACAPDAAPHRRQEG